MKQREAKLFRRGTVEEKLYHVWFNAVDRCHNPFHPAYKRYGKRGIRVCPEWKEDFLIFLTWAKQSYIEGLWLDRENNKGNYEPNNCRWITPAESRDNVAGTCWITAFGELKTASQWSKDPRCKVSRETLRARIIYGYEPEQSIITPIRMLK